MACPRPLPAAAGGLRSSADAAPVPELMVAVRAAVSTGSLGSLSTETARAACVPLAVVATAGTAATPMYPSAPAPPSASPATLPWPWPWRERAIIAALRGEKIDVPVTVASTASEGHGAEAAAVPTRGEPAAAVEFVGAVEAAAIASAASALLRCMIMGQADAAVGGVTGTGRASTATSSAATAAINRRIVLLDRHLTIGQGLHDVQWRVHSQRAAAAAVEQRALRRN